MKKKIIFLSIVCSLFTMQLKSQKGIEDFKYRRSSLSMILIESDDFPSKDVVMKSWAAYPFPEKYNQHVIDLKSFNSKDVKISDEELLAAGYLKDTLRNPMQISAATVAYKPLKYLNSNKTVAVVLPTERVEYQMKIDKVIKEKKLANQVVATWFNRSADGKFDMQLIQERGFYNATEMEAEIAKGQTRGMASLADAGEELINNTFVTFTKLDFYENEPVARLIRDVVISTAQAIPNALIKEATIESAKLAYDKAKEGYSLWSKTWLYKLVWNDSIAAVFYNDLWSNPEAFDQSDLFQLELVGTQFNQSVVTFSLLEKRTQEQIIDLALVRNVDNAFSKLQKEYDVFKPKIPILTNDPITAQIGMKEGLTGKEKFNILEMTQDPKTGLTKYVVVGTAKVNKKFLWDNRYNAGTTPAPVLDKEGNPIPMLTKTTFKGSKKAQPGMLLKQVN